jgi:hypothetical protein
MLDDPNDIAQVLDIMSETYGGERWFIQGTVSTMGQKVKLLCLLLYVSVYFNVCNIFYTAEKRVG